MPLTPDAAILDALSYHLSLFTASPALPVAYPGIAFTPPADGRYLDATFLPNRPANEPVGFNHQIVRRGLFQIAVLWPVGVGQVAPVDIGGQVAAHFARGTVIRRNGVVVSVLNAPWTSPPLQEPDRVRVPVTISWHCFSG